MRIKKISAANLSEGKILIKKELGEDAVILSTRNVKNLESGVDTLEIVAAIDEPTIKNKAIRPNNNYTTNPQLDDKIDELIRAISLPLLDYLPPNLKDIYSFLKELNFGEKFISNILKEISQNSYTDLSSDDVLNLIISKINVENLFEKKLSRKIYGFVGPSGVGKTSSLLKFAITHNILHSSKILVIGADNYNFGANELLSSYCVALDLDFVKSTTIEELEAQLNKYKSYDIILIDFDSGSQIANSTIENILILPINGNFNYLNNQLAKYSHSYVAFSGLDEKCDIQTIISLILDKNLRLCFYTNGSKIPDDIETLDINGLKKMVTGNE